MIDQVCFIGVRELSLETYCLQLSFLAQRIVRRAFAASILNGLGSDERAFG